MSALVAYPSGVASGAVFRECAGPSDAPGVAAIHAARIAVDGVDPTDSYEEYVDEARAARWLTRVQAEGELDRHVAVELDGKLAAFGYIETWSEEDGTEVYLLVGTAEQFKTRAIDLYECAGFVRHKDFPRYRKPLSAR